MQRNRNTVTVVIVNYRSDADTIRLVDTLHHNYPIIIVDNSQSLSMREEWASVSIIRAERNLGYATAVNRAIDHVSTRYLLLINPDIVIPDLSSIQALETFMDVHPTIGIAGPRLDNTDGTRQYSCRTFYTPWLPALIRTLPGLRLVRKHLMVDVDTSRPTFVDWVTGAAMMVRRDAWESVGVMDPGYFLYLEDTDWCYRMWEGGWQVAYVPAVRWVHFHQRQSRGWRLEAWWFKWQHGRSFLRYIRRRLNGGKRISTRSGPIAGQVIVDSRASDSSGRIRVKQV